MGEQVQIDMRLKTKIIKSIKVILKAGKRNDTGVDGFNSLMLYRSPTGWKIRRSLVGSVSAAFPTFLTISNTNLVLILIVSSIVSGGFSIFLFYKCNHMPEKKIRLIKPPFIDSPLERTLCLSVDI